MDANIVTITRTPEGTLAAVQFADGTGTSTELPLEYALAWSHAIVAEHSISERVRDWAGWSA